jgi:DNA-binding IscR family transcriptional regulator
VALVVLLTVAESFYREETPWTAERLANERHIPVRIVQRLFGQLVVAGYLVKAEGGVFHYPARDLEHIRISTFLAELKHLGGEYPMREADALGAVVRELMCRLDTRTDQALEDLTLKDLVERLAAESEGAGE